MFVSTSTILIAILIGCNHASPTHVAAGMPLPLRMLGVGWCLLKEMEEAPLVRVPVLEGGMEQPVAITQPPLVGFVPEIFRHEPLLSAGDGGANDGAIFGGACAGCRVLRHGEKESLSSTSSSFF